jgi:anthranilate phosphoribosyltransferase
MLDILKEVGRGKKGAKDLSYSEARRAAEWILDGRATPTQIGAFFMAERMKMEYADEILAFTDALRVRSERFSINGGLDCAGPNDGRKKSFLATLPAAFVLAACSLPVTLHSTPSLPPKRGVTLTEALEALKIPARNLPREASLTGYEKAGVLFVPSEQWCPPLKKLRPFREELGLRTLLNTSEKLLRFSDASGMAIGVFHQTAFKKAMELLTRLDIQHGLIVQGVDGSEDIPVQRRSRVALLKEGHWEEHIIDPGEWSLDGEPPQEEWTGVLQAQRTEEVLEGNGHPAYRNMVILNAGLRLWAADRVKSLQEGITQARDALDQGLALQRFRRFCDTLSTHVQTMV